VEVPVEVAVDVSLAVVLWLDDMLSEGVEVSEGVVDGVGSTYVSCTKELSAAGAVPTTASTTWVVSSPNRTVHPDPTLAQSPAAGTLHTTTTRV
jgi:hypothetical protein